MTTTFKFLGFGLCALLGALSAGCGTGSDDDNGKGGSGNMGTGGGGNATGGGGGAANSIVKLFTFDAGIEGFEFNTTASGDPMYTNLGSVDPKPTVNWGGKDYDAAAATPGCLVVEANFTGWNQSVSIEVDAPLDAMGAPVDLSNSVLRAQVWIESGILPESITNAPGGSIFYVKTGNDYSWGAAAWKNLETRKSWIAVEFDTTSPDAGSKTAAWDPSNPKQLGIQISSGGGNGHTAAEYGDPLPTKIYIDNFTVQKKK